MLERGVTLWVILRHRRSFLHTAMLVIDVQCYSRETLASAVDSKPRGTTMPVTLTWTSTGS